MTIKVYSVAEMVAAERAADAAGHGYGTMMELAGRRVAEAIHQRYELADSQVLVLVGRGTMAATDWLPGDTWPKPERMSPSIC
jgi:NAD(P)H-hydrate repair Nnr-like enzyme with NAD(P)H-hydrate epimerase domain